MGINGSKRHRNHPALRPPQPKPTGDRYVFAPATPCPLTPYTESITIRNHAAIKKETLKVEPDQENPGQFLVAFTLDASAPGSITIMFFAEENVDCNLTAAKEIMLKPITMPFHQGLGQKFRQPSGTGIDFSKFEETELRKEGDVEVYPLVLKAEAYPLNQSESDGNPSASSELTQAMFVKNEKGEYQVQVMKQVLWVHGIRYELQDIYRNWNAVDGDSDENNSGKECVRCLSEPRDTTLLPCRHMCICSGCAKVLRFQTIQCPICKQPVERLLATKSNNGPDD